MEVGRDFLILIGKEKNEIFYEGLLAPKAGEVFKKFENRSKKTAKTKKLIVIKS